MTGTDFTAAATWSELTAQPRIWRAWAETLDQVGPELRDWIASTGADEIWLSGAGTSAYIGDAIAAGLYHPGQMAIRSVPSTDIVANPRMLDGRKPLVVSFGRSGNSAESLGVMDALDARCPDAPRLNITCNRDSALARRAGKPGRVVLLPDETHDTGFAMTSSYSTMLLTALALLDTSCGEVLQRIHDMADEAERVIQSVAAAVSSDPPPARIVFIGTGALQYAAREAALKVMELTGGEVPAIWDTTLGFRHGPKSFVLDKTAIVLFRSANAYAARYDDDLAQELGAQFPTTRRVIVGPGGGADLGARADIWNVPLCVLWAQVAGVIWSAAMGYNPDDPFEGRGTLTRVVSGVTLYDPAEA